MPSGFEKYFCLLASILCYPQQTILEWIFVWYIPSSVENSDLDANFWIFSLSRKKKIAKEIKGVMPKISVHKTKVPSASSTGRVIHRSVWCMKLEHISYSSSKLHPQTKDAAAWHIAELPQSMLTPHMDARKCSSEKWCCLPKRSRLPGMRACDTLISSCRWVLNSHFSPFHRFVSVTSVLKPPQ